MKGCKRRINGRKGRVGMDGKRKDMGSRAKEGKKEEGEGR